MEIFLIGLFITITTTSIYTYRFRKKNLKEKIATKATIVDYTVVYPQRYAYIYEYTVNRMRVRAESTISVRNARHKNIGKTITIYYDKNTPTKFVQKFDTIDFVLALCIVFGLFMIIEYFIHS